MHPIRVRPLDELFQLLARTAGLFGELSQPGLNVLILGLLRQKAFRSDTSLASLLGSSWFLCRIIAIPNASRRES